MVLMVIALLVLMVVMMVVMMMLGRGPPTPWRTGIKFILLVHMVMNRLLIRSFSQRCYVFHFVFFRTLFGVDGGAGRVTHQASG